MEPRIGMDAPLAAQAAMLVLDIAKNDPHVGIVLLNRVGDILWENDLHINNFGDGIGKRCYEFYNDFSAQCKWCKLNDTLEHQSAQIAHAVSPSKTRGTLVYSDLVFLPLSRDGSSSADYVLEIILYTKLTEHHRLSAALENYNALSQLGTAVRTATTDDDIYDLLLFGSLLCLRFSVRSARVLAIIENKDARRIVAHRSIRRGMGFANALAILTQSLAIKPIDFDFLLGKCRSDLRDLDIPSGSKLEDILNARARFIPGKPCRLGFDYRSAAVLLEERLGSKTIIVAVDQEAENDFIREEDLASLYLYTAFMGQAIALRQLSNRLNTDEAQLLRRLLKLGDDARREICGTFAIQQAHEIVRHGKIISNDLRSFVDVSTKLKWIAPPGSNAPVQLPPLIMAIQNEIPLLLKAAGRMGQLITAADPMKEERLEIRKLFHEMVSRFERRVHDARIQLRLPEDGGERVVFLADKDKLETVLTNFIENAIKILCLQKGRRIINLEFKLDAFHLDICCSDNGPGVPVENVDRIWSPNFTTTIGGKGLGLPLALRLMHEHGGEALLDQTLKGKTSFVARLPRSRVKSP